MRSGRIVVIGLILLTASGCGGGEHPRHAAASPSADAPTSRAAAPRPLDQCTPAVGPGWQPLPASGIYGAPAAYLGSGRVGVVFADDSDDDPCSWRREARALASRGYAVAVFQAGGGDEARQALMIAAALRRTGPRRIVLIGASVGARAVLQAGAMRPHSVQGLVALSAERPIGSNPTDLLPQVRRVRLPLLSVGSLRDSLTNFGRDTRAFDRAIPGGSLLLVNGDAHGVDLLRGRHGARVRAAMLRFLRTT
jgi:pimeloyl-ACP methyl ester carboxylesterase